MYLWRLLRRLVLKPVEKAEVTSDLKLDRDLFVDLRIGTKQVPEMMFARSIRFFVEEGQLRGTLRSSVYSWPTFKWRTRITLLDAAGRRLASTVHISENGGVKHNGREEWLRHTLHFALEPWSSDLQERTRKVSIQWGQVPENTETTPHAWIESEDLPVVHGRVTRPDGRPIANAIVQIREKRKKGQKGIAAPDLYTDGQGFYCFDDIHWAYDVGVLTYANEASGDGYYHQYKGLNRTLHGTNKVDFILEDISKGTAGLKGQMLTADGRAVTEFKLDVRNQVDWKNQSDETLYQYGYKKQFSNPEGQFELSGLPAGKYQVMLTSTLEEHSRQFDDIVNSREYVCELAEGQTLDMTDATEVNKAWHGRVLFEDGTPAVLPGVTTEILEWSKGYDEGHVTATVDDDGCFTARFSDEVLPRLESGDVWLTINLSKSRRYFSKIQKERYPFRFMSMDKERAGTVTLRRPAFYHGRVLYQSNRPAVPPASPWGGARVSLRLRCTPATARTGGVTESLGSLDERGAFSIILTEGQYEKIEAGDYSLEIMHPSYERERRSSPIGHFPAGLLSRDGNGTTGYILPVEGMTGAHKHLARCLDSYDTLETLGALLQQWRAKHNGELPASVTQLDSATSADVLTRIVDAIDYQGGESTGPDTEAHIIAYDKGLLEIVKGTHVLFSNGSIEFLPQRKLDAVDIKR